MHLLLAEFAGVGFGTWALLGLALLLALAFEFANGFHDTANAVATVIYTHTLPAFPAVIWSGFFNFLGVLTSISAVLSPSYIQYLQAENIRGAERVYVRLNAGPQLVLPLRDKSER